MWTIQNLKQRGNAVFHKSYWRSVLAALVLSIAGGTAGGMTRTVTYHYTTEYPGSIHFYGDFGNAMEQFGNNVHGVISGFGPLLPIISLFAAITIWSFIAMRIAIDIFLLAESAVFRCQPLYRRERKGAGDSVSVFAQLHECR